MANPWIIIMVLFSLTLSNKKSGAIDSKFEKVYVAPFGQDSKRCDTQEQPCQSIAQAVRQVDWGGEIYLKGLEPRSILINVPAILLMVIIQVLTLTRA
ncbi:hypothetical protein OS493_027345 [Desmophyllum pertusum]|uniref:Uncharacterized protein n=1 Tax=Desmophyllum pertusum TaxID=174260 RepID=A0A9X0CQ15_9CNID|nr:hypothetical protein OS493_027345 [Desmophyllum pertusum]